ncbi:MAG: Hsp20/alpha crystallin family protein [Desulfomonilaceae bacterium]
MPLEIRNMDREEFFDMTLWDIQKDPWLSEFARLQKNMNSLFSALSENSPTSEFFLRRTRLFPPINIKRLEESYNILAEIPGVKADEIELSVHGDTLTIKGERKPQTHDDVSYHRRERSYGAFQRSVNLPEAVDTENIGANYKNGVLTITLPLDKASGPRKIAVSAE